MSPAFRRSLRHPPLRRLLPTFVLLSGISLGVLAYTFEVSRAERRILLRYQESAAFLGNLLASSLEFALIQKDPAQASLLLRLARTSPDLTEAALIDSQETILLSASRDLTGPLSSHPQLASGLLLSRQALETQSSQLSLEPGPQLLAAFPVRLAAPSQSLRHDYNGTLLLAYDLSLAAEIARTQARKGSLPLLVAVLISSGLLWLVLDFAITRRMGELLRASKALARGDLSARSRLSGADEFAQLSSAFDSMARQIQGRTEELHRNETRLRLALAAGDLTAHDWDLRTPAAAAGDTPSPDLSRLGAVHPEDLPRLADALEAALRHRTPEDTSVRAEYHVLPPEGPARWKELHARILHDPEGRSERLIGVDHDITPRKESLLRHEELESELLTTIQGRDEFLSIASHELKTPLTALHLQLQLVSRLLQQSATLPAGNSRLQERLETAVRMTTRLGQLIETLLDLSRLQLGRLQLDPEEVELVAVVRDSLHRYATVAESAGTSLTLAHAPPSLPARLDRLRIEQVLSNLLSNAIKYGGGSPIEVEIRQEGSKAEITVRDHGPGIAPQDLERIFGRYERAISHTSISGFGLGLYISRQIAEAHQGSLTAQSAPGQGSGFTLTLPLPSE